MMSHGGRAASVREHALPGQRTVRTDRRGPFIWLCDGGEVTTPLVRDESHDREIAATETELGETFPDVDGDVIHTLVQDSYDRLTPAKVDIYLPILVSHDVRDSLHDLDLA